MPGAHRRGSRRHRRVSWSHAFPLTERQLKREKMSGQDTGKGLNETPLLPLLLMPLLLQHESFVQHSPLDSPLRIGIRSS